MGLSAIDRKAASISSAKPRASGWRASGSNESARRITASTEPGIAGFNARSRGGSKGIPSDIRLRSCSLNGRSPVRSWNPTAPSPNTSAAGVRLVRPRSCSGDAYAGECGTRPSWVSCASVSSSSASLAMPKSTTRTWMSSACARARKMLPGLTSRWMSPCACPIARPRADSIRMRSDVESGGVPTVASWLARSEPRSSSMTR